MVHERLLLEEDFPPEGGKAQTGVPLWSCAVVSQYVKETLVKRKLLFAGHMVQET